MKKILTFLTIAFLVASVLCPLLARREEYECSYTVYVVTFRELDGTFISSYELYVEECGYVWYEEGGSSSSSPGGPTGSTGGCKTDAEFVIPKQIIDLAKSASSIEVSGDFNGDGFSDEWEMVELNQNYLTLDWFFRAVQESHFKAIRLEEGPLSDGILVVDLDGDGVLSSSKEMLGNQFNEDNLPTLNAATALQLYDHSEWGGNQNGVIDSGDYFWEYLYFWQDVNHDKLCQNHEMISMRRARVQSVDPFPIPVHRSTSFQIKFTQTNGVTLDGFLR